MLPGAFDSEQLITGELKRELIILSSILGMNVNYGERSDQFNKMVNCDPRLKFSEDLLGYKFSLFYFEPSLTTRIIFVVTRSMNSSLAFPGDVQRFQSLETW